MLVELLLEWLKESAWMFVPFFYVAAFILLLVLLFLIFWIIIPDWLKWPYRRLDAERAFVIDIGRNIKDPGTANDKGNAAGFDTEGVFEKVVISLVGYTMDKDGNVVPGEEEYGGFWDKLLRRFGFYWVGLTRVFRIMRNKWYEVEDKGGVKALIEKRVVEYGVTLKRTPMGFELKNAPDKGNFKFTFIGLITWSITNVLDAKVYGQDTHELAVGRLTDALLAFVKEREIYRPPAEKGEENIDMEDGTESEETNEDNSNAGEEISVDKIGELFRRYCEEENIFGEIQDDYGYTIYKVAFVDIIADPRVQEILEARATSHQKGRAKFVDERWETLVQKQRGIWTKDWGPIYRDNPEAVARGIIDVADKHGLPLVSGATERLLEKAIPGIGDSDTAKIIAIIEAREKSKKEEQGGEK